MKKTFAITLCILFCLFLFCSCGQKKVPGNSNINSEYTNAQSINQSELSEAISNDSLVSSKTSFSKDDKEMFTSRDAKSEYSEDGSVQITLKGNSASSNDSSVKISGTTVTITKNVTHIISGTLNNGTIIVDAPDNAKLTLVLNGANIESKTSAALYIKNADKVFLTLAKGTKNTIKNGGEFKTVDDNNIDGALFSKEDLTLNGEGSLTVTSPAGHGIVCKDDLAITGGNYTVVCSNHAIDTNDSVRISSARLSLEAGKDGIHCENDEDESLGFVYVSSGDIKITAEGDGISASSYMQIENGSLNITAGGGSENGSKQYSDSFGGFPGGRPVRYEPQQSANDVDATSMKGLKSETDMLIKNGKITINSADDSIHSNKTMTISGGEIKLASGDDAVHAEETLTVNSGNIDISESYEGLEAQHIKVKSGNIKLSATDDGLNAAGGVDSSGSEGGRDGMFGGFGGRPGGPGGMSSSSNGSIVISGGTLYIKASGDGIDANGTLEITGGHTTVTGPTKGDTSVLDFDKSAVISGGTFIGTGAAGMSQNFSDSKHGSLFIRNSNQSAGTVITLKNSSGKTIISHKPELDFALIVISSPDIEKGKTYTLSVGSQTSQITAQ